MMPQVFTLRDFVADYAPLVDYVQTEGERVVVRGLPTHEVTGVTLDVPNVLQPMLPIGIARGVNTRLAAVEALSLIGGTVRGDLIMRAAPSYASVLVDPTKPTQGAYGPRVAVQMHQVVETLRRDPMSRQAVMTIWKPVELWHRGDLPCTIALQFIIRHDALDMHVMMRSQDVWRGVAYDLFMFTQLQLSIARVLRVPPGRYVHHVTSLHLYESDVEAAGKLISPSPDHHMLDLPLGVVTRHDGDDRNTVNTLQDTARAILTVPITDDHPALNPWYGNVIASIPARVYVNEEA